MKKAQQNERRQLRPIRFLTSQPLAAGEGDLLLRCCSGLKSGLEALVRKLRLSRLLDGSVFLHPWLFCFLTLALTPFLPTMAMLALTAATFLSLMLTYGKGRGRQRLHAPALRWAGLLAAVYFLSVFTSVSPTESLYPGLLMAAFILSAFAAFLSIRSWGDLRRAFCLIALAAVAVSLYGFWQRLHPEAYQSGWLDKDMFSSVVFRVYSTLQNPNVLGEYLLLVTPFAFALALTAKNRRKKLLWTLAGVAMCVCMLLTYSRGCYLGLALSAVIFLVLLDRRFLILIAAALILCPFLLPDAIRTRILSIGDLGDTSTQYRVNIWLGALEMLRDFWPCGAGPGEGAFNTVYPLYSLSAIDAPHAHSLYLQIFLETGIGGLLVFLGFVGSLYRSLLSALYRVRRRESKIFAIAGLSAFSGFLLQSFTDYSFYNYRVTLLFFLLAGLCMLLGQETALWEAHGTAGKLALSSREKPMVLQILSDSNLGGAGRYLLNLFSAHDREQYQMVLALPRGGALVRPAQALDIPVIELDMAGEKSADFRSLTALRQLCMLLEPDIVQTHGSLSGRVAARACRAKIVYTRHSVFPVSRRLRSGPGHLLSKLLNGHYTDLAIAVSPAAAENLIELGLKESHIVTVMNGAAPLTPADAGRKAALRQSLGIREGDFTAGIFARLEEYKGHDTILEAAAMLKSQGRQIRILICGAGSRENALREKIKNMGLEDTVVMTGFVENVGELLSIMDVQLNASTGTEATSLSLIEGMSLGLPTIASSYGGTPYLIHPEQEGLLFPPGDSAALADCLRRLMDDPDLMERLSRTAKDAYGRCYTNEAFARAVEAAYRKVLEKEAHS